MFAKNERLIKLREAKGMTQENLAHKSNVSVRTVQRAEAGSPIDIETLAQLAATLGVLQEDLVASNPFDTGDYGETQLAVLLPAKSGKEVADLFRVCADANIDHLVDISTTGKVESVLQFLDAIEPHLPTLTPEIDWDAPALNKVQKIRQKIQLEQMVQTALEAMKSIGLQLYIGQITAMIVVPRYDQDEGCWATRVGQKRAPVQMAVLRIDASGKERVVVHIRGSQE
jgi:transcriptional regulator with XRE-family HTH domain